MILQGEWRADIEGLRAVAILSVVAAHAGLSLAPGGFTGVDIFFVLSGYLITGLLVRELARTGTIDFAMFYARRLQRLLPGLALMLVVVVMAAAVLLAPYEQVPQASTLSLAFLWLSNFHFSLADFGYFDAASETNLLLHTWSLGVEEQFYLVWPLLLLWLFSGGGNPMMRTNRLRRGLAWILFVGLATSLMLSYASPLWGFYSMPSRAWQFALGGLVYLYADTGSSALATPDVPHPRHRAFHLAAGWAGATLILGSVLFLHERMTYPGLWALLPSAGAALVIIAGTRQAATHGFGRVLTLPPMRFLGKVSYSWYLWHWPVFVLGDVLQPEATLGFRMALIAISLLLAVVAYFILEQPLRVSTWLRARPAYTLAGSLVVMASGAILGSAWAGTAGRWAEAPDQVAFQQLRNDVPQLYSQGCDEWISSAQVRVCSYGQQDAQNTAVLFGDSVGLQWFSALAPHYLQSGWRVLVVTKSSCPMVDVPIFYERIGAEYVVCEQWRSAAVQFLAQLKPAVIFMGSTATYAYSPEEWRDGSARILAPLAAAAGKVYVIRGTPRLAFDGPGCLARLEWQPAMLASLYSCASRPQTLPDEAVDDALRTAAAPFANVRVVDFNPILCPDGLCRAKHGDSVVFRDFQHIANAHVASLQQEVWDVIAAAK
ncbi:MAG TPA: acyltransferase family protein [Pseudomonadales bacterium]